MVAGELVYVGSCGGAFYALERETGEVRWWYDTREDGRPANFHGAALVAGELVVVGSDLAASEAGHLYAFDRASGEVGWQRSFQGGVPYGVLRAGGRIYALSLRGEAVCLDLGTGEIAWRFAEPENRPSIGGAPVLSRGRLFFGSRTGRLFALDAGSGEVLWERGLGSRRNTSTTLAAGGLYVGTEDGRLRRFDPETGAEEASFETGGLPYGTLVAAAGCLIALWRQEEVGGDGALRETHTLACLDPSLGGVRWQRTGGAQWSAFEPLVRGGLVYAGNEEGDLIVLRLEDGEEAWSRRFEGEVLRGLGVSGGVAYVGTLDGDVYAVRLPALDRGPPETSGGTGRSSP